MAVSVCMVAFVCVCVCVCVPFSHHCLSIPSLCVCVCVHSCLDGHMVACLTFLSFMGGW